MTEGFDIFIMIVIISFAVMIALIFTGYKIGKQDKAGGSDDKVKS